MEVKLNDIDVMYVAAEGGVRGGKEAFDKLESKLPNLKKRKFYGALLGTPEKGEYRACVAIREEDNPVAMGLKTWVIPGGRYTREKIKGWWDKLNLIGPVFKSMAENHTVDSSRPSIEFYRSQEDLILLLPIK